jgi:hypothetical protein
MIYAFLLAAQMTMAPAPQMPADQKMPPECAAMMQDKQAMQKQMSEMDSKLNSLVEAMNTASGPDKLDKISAVVNELVAQHQAMHKNMASMSGEMDCPMMKSASKQAAKMDCPMMNSASKKSAATMDCPMMKGASSEHAQHHH